MCFLLNFFSVTVHIYISLITLEHICHGFEIISDYSDAQSDKRAELYLYKKWPAPPIDTRYTREVTDSELIKYRPTSPRLNYHLHGEEPSLMSYCGGDGVCISSTACDWDLIVQDDADCIKEHKDFVCCTATTVHVPENVFKAYDWWS